jgi:UDP-sulfoquinovose synthase
MQGVVFGIPDYPSHAADRKLCTRLDFDQAFGTVINRFCCEAIISHAITVYGDGTQIRSFLPLKDSMQCVKLVIQNPPSKREYKVINQFANTHSINELASIVAGVCKLLDMEVKIAKMKNPRKETEKHYYNPDNQNLKNLGYAPSNRFEDEIMELIQSIKPFKKRIFEYSNMLNPTITW